MFGHDTPHIKVITPAINDNSINNIAVANKPIPSLGAAYGEVLLIHAKQVNTNVRAIPMKNIMCIAPLGSLGRVGVSYCSFLGRAVLIIIDLKLASQAV